MGIPEHGISREQLLAELADKRTRDVRWQEGRTFGMVYDGGESVHEVAEAAAIMYLHENALNTMAFPSLGEIQREVCDMTAALLHGDTAAGFMTSGGTESILCAVKAARERAKAERGITQPEIVLAETAHAAFHKAAHYFGLIVHKVKVRDDFRADVDAMAAAVNDNTALVVGSAPQYPQGVIDPIPDLAELAATVGASMHVDDCMGSFVLPFMEMVGYELSHPWDFRVDGVTTISADIHKLGYAPKGASVILHRDKHLRQYQTFVFDDWLGGFYASPNIQGTRSGLPMATAWAVMRHIGLDGYCRLTSTTIETRRKLEAGVRAIEGLTVLGQPEAQLMAIAAAPGYEDRVDIFALGDALVARGWFHDRQGPPDTLHATVSAGNAPVADEYLRDLAACVEAVTGIRAVDRSTNYATLE